MDEKIYSRNNVRLPNLLPKNLKNKQKQQILIQVIAIILIAISFAYFIIQSIKPIMENQCISMAKSIATKISNDEATEVMKKYTYDDLLIITKDEDGNIKMIGTNVVTVNEIISNIPVRIQKALEKSENNNFSIRLGSFFGTKFFSR